MRTLTLLELLVEWEHIPHDQFIVVWVYKHMVHDEQVFDAAIWQRGCCNSGARMHGIEGSIKGSPHLRCEIHTDPMDYYDFDPEKYHCVTCRRPISNHFTLAQCEAIVDKVLG